MYKTHTRFDSFILYRIEANGQFHLFKEFSDFDSLITYFAKSEIADSGLPWKREPKSILGKMNLTGNDTFVNVTWTPCYFEKYYGVSAHRETMLRPYLLMDRAGRIIDPHNLLAEINKKRAEITNNNPVHHYWRHLPPFEYRYDPVPYTGVRHTKYGRRVRHWFRSYRADRIPEYEQFVRKKGMVPNTWDTEPFEPRYRSWKHNSKKRHQWE